MQPCFGWLMIQQACTVASECRLPREQLHSCSSARFDRPGMLQPAQKWLNGSQERFREPQYHHSIKVKGNPCHGKQSPDHRTNRIRKRNREGSATGNNALCCLVYCPSGHDPPVQLPVRMVFVIVEYCLRP